MVVAKLSSCTIAVTSFDESRRRDRRLLSKEYIDTCVLLVLHPTVHVGMGELNLYLQHVPDANFCDCIEHAVHHNTIEEEKKTKKKDDFRDIFSSKRHVCRCVNYACTPLNLYSMAPLLRGIGSAPEIGLQLALTLYRENRDSCHATLLPCIPLPFLARCCTIT